MKLTDPSVAKVGDHVLVSVPYHGLVPMMVKESNRRFIVVHMDICCYSNVRIKFDRRTLKTRRWYPAVTRNRREANKVLVHKQHDSYGLGYEVRVLSLTKRNVDRYENQCRRQKALEVIDQFKIDVRQTLLKNLKKVSQAQLNQLRALSRGTCAQVEKIFS